MFTLRRLSVVPRSLPKLLPLCKPVTRIIPSLLPAFPSFPLVRYIRTTRKQNQSRLVKLQIQKDAAVKLQIQKDAVIQTILDRIILMIPTFLLCALVCMWISFIIKLLGEVF